MNEYLHLPGKANSQVLKSMRKFSLSEAPVRWRGRLLSATKAGVSGLDFPWTAGH